ncbi:MAG: phage tail protein, partial [Pyramidobacter sp.]|nr:phage tail protein [Pyramidobacter sp.]
MPTTYRATLTEVGAALVADAIASGTTIVWAKMALGDGNGSAVTVDP